VPCGLIKTNAGRTREVAVGSCDLPQLPSLVSNPSGWRERSMNGIGAVRSSAWVVDTTAAVMPAMLRAGFCWGKRSSASVSPIEDLQTFELQPHSPLSTSRGPARKYRPLPRQGKPIKLGVWEAGTAGHGSFSACIRHADAAGDPVSLGRERSAAILRVNIDWSRRFEIPILSYDR
jgi:hypothetical protein